MEGLKLLVSAYACEPGKGSEPGVGWRWALEAARLGHSVWVITRENNQAGIDAALAALAAGGHRPPTLRFAYFDLPAWARRWKRGGRGVHLYYLLWQWGAYRFARRLHVREKFDAVHHITFGVTRQPSFMGRLGIPFVIGPLGGGERAPWRLRRHFPLAGYLKDAARDLANGIARHDPFVRAMLAEATVILLKTPESMAWLPRPYRQKAHCMLEIGIDAPKPANPPAAETADGAKRLRMLYVGRFIYMKGVAFGLQAMAEARRRGVEVELTLIGSGPEETRWRARARQLGIEAQVAWISWLPHDELLAAYRRFDALLFPSLHDSSGNVVLEALARGLPVICLDLGGPPRMVDDTCGRVVGVAGRSEPAVVDALADAMTALAADPPLRACLRRGACARAGQFGWGSQVAAVWGEGGLGYRQLVESPVEVGAYGRA